MVAWGVHGFSRGGACVVAPRGGVWLPPGVGMRGFSRGGMRGCSGGCMVSPGGGACMVAPGGMHGI